MPETLSQRPSDDQSVPEGTPSIEQARGSAGVEPVRRGSGADPVVQRVRGARAGLALLLAEAKDARRARAEAGDGATAVCAWNHFENIPTFYNWNNRPR